jgi:hypothetical protein
MPRPRSPGGRCPRHRRLHDVPEAAGRCAPAHGPQGAAHGPCSEGLSPLASRWYSWAPCGFGKTSLLAEWATTTDVQAAWLSCDESCGERRSSGPAHLLPAAQLAGPQVHGAYVTMDTPRGAIPGSEGAAAPGSDARLVQDPLTNLKPAHQTDSSSIAGGDPLGRQRQVTHDSRVPWDRQRPGPGCGGELAGWRSVCQAAGSRTGSQTSRPTGSQGPRHHTVAMCRVVPPW